MNRAAENARSARWNLWLGAGTLAFVALCLFVWFPRDIGSGFLQQNLTGRTVPGDSFFPVLLIGLMVPLAVLLIVAQIGARSGKNGEVVGHIGLRNLLFLAQMVVLTGLGLLVMDVTGPALVWATNAVGLSEASGYRAVSATFPFDVSGFFVGGTLLTCGYTFVARHRLRWRDVLIAVVTTAVLIGLFDGLLNDIQLPPNADI
ncbi:hypothetical protein FA743_16070 [Paracoccus gahaiensis]|uniref:Uncharacterized protein n=1 Tax=Paracoccus gahaiensis TaxID=1706839 RepID=A0A4U0R7A9_9RHOB|nr:tripartite tricarboxylate transporter TctB family protein [Paracoccus gahaiensis]TJZ90280.1 hypothetical protein FA743_16070 [Paracoccus gahaiensis]